MSEVEELEARIINLPRQDIAKLREWFLELDNQLWDQQIASASKAGEFQELIDKAWVPPLISPANASTPQPASLADLFAGRVGRIVSGGRERLSELGGTELAAELERRRREGCL